MLGSNRLFDQQRYLSSYNGTYSGNSSQSAGSYVLYLESVGGWAGEYPYWSAGTASSYFDDVSVMGVAVTPVANFTAVPRSGLAPLSVSFTDTSTGNPTSWLWNFGDGSNNTIQNPVHTYNNIGIYSVNLNSQTQQAQTTLQKTVMLR